MALACLFFVRQSSDPLHFYYQDIDHGIKGKARVNLCGNAASILAPYAGLLYRVKLTFLV